jgi:hypothetical protein
MNLIPEAINNRCGKALRNEVVEVIRSLHFKSLLICRSLARQSAGTFSFLLLPT